MKLLAFDTCFNKTYIALKNDDEILGLKTFTNTDSGYHSAFLMPGIRDILKSCGLFIKDMDVIAVNTGPGSFTGVRACVSAARVFAWQFNIKLIGVSSLMILSKLNNKNLPSVTALDARKNKVYFAKYFQNKEIIPPCLIDKDELISKLTGNEVIISDNSVCSFLEENNISSVSFEDCNENLALYLCDIAQSMLKNNSDDFNWAKVKPLYLKKPSITVKKEICNEKNGI